MIRHLFIACLLFVAAPFALANDQSDVAADTQTSDLAATESGDLERANVCYDYDRNPQICNGIWYCEYDYRRRECNYTDDSNGGGGGRYCSDYNRNPRRCDQQRGCEWDSRRGVCQDSYDPYPTQCWQYRDYRSCDAVRDCFWDRRLNSCVDAR